MASLAGAAPLSAQDAPDWMSGVWTERTGVASRSNGRRGGDPPATLQVATGNGLLRIRENGTNGQDLRCRLDGSEGAYRQTTAAATIDYVLACEVGPQVVEVAGRFTADGVDGFPPRQFEILKRYERAPDGTLRAHDQLWGLVPGLGRVQLGDAVIAYAKSR